MGRRAIIFPLMMSVLGLQAQTDSIASRVHALQGVEIVSLKNKTVAATVPVQMITEERMLNLGIMTLADALTHIAGITVRDYGGAGGMKTVSVRGIGSRHTGVIYDGIALSDCQTGEIDLSRYSLDNVSMLKMVIGEDDNIFLPARSTSSAAALVIDNLKSPTEDHSAHLKARLTYGSWNTVVPSLYYGQSLSDRLSLSVMGEFTHSDNDYPFKIYNVKLLTKERRQNSKMNSGHLETNLLWKITDRQTLSGKLYYYDNNRQLPGIVHLYNNKNSETLHDQNAFAQAGYYATLSDRFSLQGNLKYNWAKSDYRNGNPASGIPDGRYYQQEYYASVAALYSPKSWLAFSYAGDYFYNALTTGQTASGHPSRHSLLQTLSAKVATGRLTVVSRLLWSNYINEVRAGETGKDGRRLSPSISLSYRLLSAEELYIRAFWKSIFRMPTFNELYYYHIGSTDLRPEKTRQLNLGVTYAKRQRRFETSLTLDGYLNRVDDKIVAIPFNMFVWHMMNLAKVTVYGVDFTANARYSLAARHALELNGNYSWQRAENQSNKNSEYYKNQIAYTPEHTFCATMTWHNPWANFTCAFDGMDERWTTNSHSAGTRIPGFVEMDASLWRTFPLKKYTLTARAAMMNIADKQYDLVAHYPMPGRSWRISITLEI
ncbi:TonB-dependent siderophore receptor [Prevotella sp. KH2C16]|uniref:TonB-dependent receptor plug domain-containing protein n=1 Tax=Prevotella sp. KH2C16 TaxID=1855325 RepID=UPI0008E0712F|nr:TonB-dependent receptor [Prevotella sp. KH2C16]SFG20470.1 Outer membrane cobalamin receptor protein [Prevotella sp. KH2C16]